MQPSEFWKLPICDWWTELDGKIEQNRKIEEQIREASGEKTGPTEADWEDARRRHRAKMEKLKDVDRACSP